MIDSYEQQPTTVTLLPALFVKYCFLLLNSYLGRQDFKIVKSIKMSFHTETTALKFDTFRGTSWCIQVHVLKPVIYIDSYNKVYERQQGRHGVFKCTLSYFAL